MRKAQVAIEYMMLIAFVLVILIPLVYYSSGRANTEIRGQRAQDMVDSIARAADSISVYGPGTKEYVWVVVPSGILSTSLDNSQVFLQMGIFGNTTDFHSGTTVNLTGVIPTNVGRHKLELEVLEDGTVRIGQEVVSNQTSGVEVSISSAAIYRNPQHTFKSDQTSKVNAIDGDEKHVSKNNEVMHVVFDEPIGNGDRINLYVTACHEDCTIEVREDGIGAVVGTGNCIEDADMWVNITISTSTSSAIWDLSCDENVDYNYISALS